MSCRHMYFEDVVTYTEGGRRNVHSYPHCFLKKADPIHVGVLVADAFSKKYQDEGLVDNPSSNCPWHIHNDEKSCPIYES